MSASNWLFRARDRFCARGLSSLPVAGRWIGVDLAGHDRSRHARRLLPLLVLALITALGIEALRIDLIRIRYAMASVVKRESDLLEEQRELIVRRRQLRDPVGLAVAARARGFRPPHQIIVLRDPKSGSPQLLVAGHEARIEAPPSVAAAPPLDRARGDWQ